MSRLRALAANMAAVVTGKAATAVVGLLTIVALTRHLGPTEFGYYRTVLTYSAFRRRAGRFRALHGDPAGDVAARRQLPAGCSATLCRCGW